jgi:hypothetical protein
VNIVNKRPVANVGTLSAWKLIPNSVRQEADTLCDFNKEFLHEDDYRDYKAIQS